MVKTQPAMEIKQVIRRQYLVTFDEEEAQDIRAYLDGLQESDYEQPFKRNQVEAADIQARIKKTMGKLRDSLQMVPAVHLAGDTRRS